MNATSNNSNNSSDTSDQEENICYWFVVSTSVILPCVLCAVNCVGNTISFYIWNKIGKKKGYNSSVILMMCLAIANMVYEIPGLFVNTLTNFSWHMGYIQDYVLYVYPYLSKYVYPIISMGNFVKCWLTMLITAHRFAVLSRPFASTTHRLVSVKSTLLQAAIVSFIAACYNIPRFFEVDIVTVNDTNMGKIYNDEILSELYLHPAYQLYYMTVSYLLLVMCVPLVTCIVLTAGILQLLAKARSSRQQMTASGGDHTDSSNKEAAITTTLLTVVIIFIICQTPTVLCRMGVAIIVDVDYSCGTFMYYVPSISAVFLSVDASVTVFVYTRCSQHFRNTLKSMCCRCYAQPESAKESKADNAARGFSSASNATTESSMAVASLEVTVKESTKL